MPGCGFFRLNTASWSPLTDTLSTLAYQPLRKLTLRVSSVRSASRSQVHFTSAAVKGLPSCHFTPCRNAKVSFFPSSLHAQLVAKSGTMPSRLFCGLCGSNMTRLLKTPIIGITTEIVPSSWIDILAGLSRCAMRKMPPAFCAQASDDANTNTTIAMANCLCIDPPALPLRCCHWRAPCCLNELSSDVIVATARDQHILDIRLRTLCRAVPRLAYRWLGGRPP